MFPGESLGVGYREASFGDERAEQPSAPPHHEPSAHRAQLVGQRQDAGGERVVVTSHSVVVLLALLYALIQSGPVGRYLGKRPRD
jgi:hypothetical protein